jgi:type IV secretory pathway TraG/TraD family ATPase VirD4
MPIKKTQSTSQGSHQDWIATLTKPDNLPYLVMGGAVLLLLLLQIFGRRKSSRLAQSRWGGKSQLKSAEKAAKAQIFAYSKKNLGVAQTGGYIGKPFRIWYEQGGKKQNPLRIAKEFCFNGKTLWFPNLQQSAITYGAAGLGKTFSVINPLIRSLIDQKRASIVVYDFKYPEQSAEIAGYAKKYGYKIQVFAPSFLESGTLNLIEMFVSDSGDSIGAAQIATTIIENFKTGSESDGNPFFTEGGINLFSASIMLSKFLHEDEQALRLIREIWEVPEGQPVPLLSDFVTCAAILNLPELGQRMLYNRNRIGAWMSQAFSQVASLAANTDPGKANQTEGSLVATAQNKINQLVRRAFIPAICGESNIATKLDGEQALTLTIMGLNQDYRDITSPILAAALDLIISRNIAHERKRSSPLLFSFDEAASIRLKKIANWAAESRSAGYIGIPGFQSKKQAEQIGKEWAGIVNANYSTKFFLNPQDAEAAEDYQKYLGEEEITYWTTSTSSQRGSSGSSSRTQQITKRWLKEAAEWLRMPPGRAVIINSGYLDKRSKERGVPVERDIKIPQRDLAEINAAKPLWEKFRRSMILRTILSPVSRNQEDFNKNFRDMTAMLDEEERLRKRLQERSLPQKIAEFILHRESWEVDPAVTLQMEKRLAEIGSIYGAYKAKYEKTRDEQLVRDFERRNKLLDRLFPPPPPKNAVKMETAPLVKYMEGKGWKLLSAPAIDPQTAVLPMWMGGDRLNLPKDDAGIELLAIVLANNGFKMQKQKG